MQQQPTRLCPNCGIAASIDQRFCSNCGAVLDQDVANPTMQIGEQNATPSVSSVPSVPSVPPPPPDIDQYSTFRQQSNYPAAPPLYGSVPAEGPGHSLYTGPTQGQTPPPYTGPTGPTQGQASPLYTGPTGPTQGQAPYIAPTFANPQQDNSGKILRRIGCGAGLVIVLVLALCGALSYGAYVFISKSVASTSTTSTNNGTSTTQSSSYGSTPAAVPVQTVPLNLSIKYATITYSIVDIKRASSFEDDHSSTPGVIRVDLKEVNATSQHAIFSYSDTMHLVLPDQSSIAPLNYKNSSPPANGATQDNWLDFPLPMTTSIDKLILRFGTPQEAQMDVPLKAGSDLAKFQDVTVKPNSATTYSNLHWTLTSATLSWSGYSKQADSGKRYVTINVSVDNPTATTERGYWGDYLRLKAGSTTSSPETDSTIPLDFPASSTGNMGSASFQVPQESTTFTIILLANNIETSSQQATLDFHIP